MKIKKVESTRNVLVIELQTNLRRRRAELAEKLENSTSNIGQGQLDGRRQELISISKIVDSLNQRSLELDNEIEELTLRLTELSAEMEKAKVKKFSLLFYFIFIFN